ncbi:hypothetical protein K461DRAFT_271393 [Myriangium duriaei CBS 260.36]|uniref:Uncharacterized protein n=1 Tax=Myriangium duriaei CBS 260.36 TaxID=1168546 RepID=A0A9P4IU52_9PEZI|nr:hypothetical protein K461DRAFT_271393 [Myriangium duriaei CBS 260.36]
MTGLQGGATGVRSPLTKQLLRSFTTSALRSANSPPPQTPKANIATSSDKHLQYPSALNIFHSGTALTAYIGTIKLAGIYVFAQACLIQAPTIYIDSPDDFWWTPAAIALSSVPMILLQLMTGPFVNSINVKLPDAARRSPQGMKEFCRRPPPDTRLSFTTLRFIPLPKRRAVRLEDLRVLPQRVGRIANLEYLPPKLRQRCEERGREPSWLEGFIGGRRRFHVRPGERYTTSTRGPGIWSDLLEVIKRQSGVKVETPAPTPSQMRRQATRQASRQAARPRRR